MGRPSIVVFDDHPGQEIGKTVRVFLQRENRYKLDLIDQLLLNPADVCQSGPDLIISVLPAGAERAGRVLETLRGPKADVPLLPVISPETLSEMLDGPGFWTKDFLVPPLRGAEVCARVRQWFVSRSGGRETPSVNTELTEAFELTRLVGQAPALLALKRKIPLIAQSESTVLITGETGTGKEICARALHYLSRRAGKPFLPVNCGAIPVELFENELFGHQKGAFTSA